MTSGRSAPVEPFFSVVVRTTGGRAATLRETLTSLERQSDRGFELILILHRVGPPDGFRAEAVFGCVPEALRGQARLLVSTRPGRSSPLNDAVDAAAGTHLLFLDDDDFVLPNWIATFRAMAEEAPGALLRTVCLRQKWRIGGDGGVGARPIGPRERAWPDLYDLSAHLGRNETPFMTMAFPREAFEAPRLRFDETLTTLEDWHLTTIAALWHGVASRPVATAVYRWWVDGWSSSLTAGRDEWNANAARVGAAITAALEALPADRRAEVDRRLRAERAARRRGLARRLERFAGKISVAAGRLAWRLAGSRAVPEIEPPRGAAGEGTER